MSFETAVLFLVFNRPDHTKKVFDRIREVKPRYLFVAADGPRKSHPEDKQKCERVRQLILDSVDWDCEFRTLFRETNLGCGLSVSSSINWFFQNVEEGIILEDDTVPDPSFFFFCQKMLSRYRNDKDVMHIAGSNFQFGKYKEECSYYFSRYPVIWGWATWRRAWNHYNFNFKDHFSYEIIRKNCQSDMEANVWFRTFHGFLDGKCDTWDYSWTYAVWQKEGLSIVPNKNLIANIGIGRDSTHTLSYNRKYFENQVQSIEDDIIYRSDKTILVKADKFYYDQFIKPEKTSIPNRIRNFVYWLVGKKNYSRLKQKLEIKLFSLNVL